jgi:hypothetical protein
MALPVIGNVVTLKSRKDGYASTYAGERWIVKNPTPGTGFLGGTSLSRTAPVLAIYQTNLGATPPTERPITLSTLTISQVSTVAGGAITILVATDSTNRYSAGGTAITPQRCFAEAAITAGFTARSLPTLTADGSTDYDVWEATIPAVTGSAVTIDFGDAVRIGKTGTIMVYAFAATTGPTITINAEIIEEIDSL